MRSKAKCLNFFSLFFLCQKIKTSKKEEAPAAAVEKKNKIGAQNLFANIYYSYFVLFARRVLLLVSRVGATTRGGWAWRATTRFGYWRFFTFYAALFYSHFVVVVVWVMKRTAKLIKRRPQKKKWTNGNVTVCRLGSVHAAPNFVD